MAQTTILSSINRSDSFPIIQDIQSENNCGMLSLILTSSWSDQMIYELPTINISVYIDSDTTKVASIDIDMTTVNNEMIEVSPTQPYTIPIYNLPSECTVHIMPLFDKYSLSSHNETVNSGNISFFNTSNIGIVNTSNDYSNDLWTTETQIFDISIIFDDQNIVPGGSGGGGGGGTPSFPIDTQVNSTSTNPVQNKAIYSFVNSSVATNTSNFIDTFDSVEELESYSGTVTNNDYAFVVSIDSDGNTIYSRYKYSEYDIKWKFEYTLNNSSFTAAQWATIQSGLTQSDKTKYDNHISDTNNPHNVTKSQIGLGNVDNTSDINKPISTATRQALDNKSDKTNTVTNVSYDTTTGKLTKTINETTSDILTVDSSLNDTSTNPVQNKVVTQRFSSLQEDLSAEETTREESDSEMQAEINVVSNLGAKNLLPITAQSKTINGVTFIVNNDQTITINGTASAIADFNLNAALQIEAGDYILTGCPTGGDNSSTYKLQIQGVGYDTGSGYSFSSTGVANRVYIRIWSGYTANNLVFKPMIRRAEITDDTYVPYAKTNRELTVAENEDRTALVEQMNSGAKNLLRNIRETTTHRGITFTVASDGTVTANGTNDGTGASILNINTQSNVELPDGNYVLSGCPQGGSATGYFLDVTRSGGSSINDTGNGVEFTVGGDYTVNEFRIVISRNVTVDNVTFKPMICTVADYAISSDFVPYAPTNRELYETKATVNDIYGYGVLIPANADLNNYTTPGRYYGSNDTGNTALNLPVANDTFTFSLEVKAATPSMTYQYIKICRLADDPFIYIRRKYNTWGSWYKFEGTPVTTA